MTKVLVGFMTSVKDGGINKYLINLFTLLKNEEVTFDVLTSNETEYSSICECIGTFGGNAFLIPRVIHPKAQKKAVVDIIKKNNYDICYFNISEAFNYIAIKAASICGVKKIYVHSHSSGNDTSNKAKRKMLETAHYKCKKKLEKYGTDFFSCSDFAGKWMYSDEIINSDKYHIIYNAVDYDKFKFNENVRDEYRKNLGLEGKLVVGHVSNFVYQKNIPYLLEIIKELVALSKDAVLLSVGEGPEWEDAKKKAKEYGIDNNIQFLGRRDDVSKLMQAMDLFVLPSRFEGLPVVGVEAQTAGLPCIFADTITKEVKLSNEAVFLPIDVPAKKWAEVINGKKYDRIDVSKLENSNFDIKTQKDTYLKMFLN